MEIILLLNRYTDNWSNNKKVGLILQPSFNLFCQPDLVQLVR